MRKNLMPMPGIFPQPIALIATYCDDNSVDVMPAAWARSCAVDRIAISLGTERKTLMNIMLREAFTISFADVDHLKEIDYLGIVSAYSQPDKFLKSGLHASKSKHVDAPIIDEFPLTIECALDNVRDEFGEKRILGKIINFNADTRILDASGKIDVSKLNLAVFEQFKNGYYSIGKQIGKAFEIGKEFLI